MSTVTTLIQAAEIVNTGIVSATPLNKRFDASKIAPSIHLAEDRFFKTFVCTAFYDDLIAQKNPTPSNYNIKLGAIVLAYPSNADYEKLWTQYFLPYLSRAVYLVALPDIVIQTGSNGLFVNSTEFGENLGIKGLSFMQDTQLQNLDGRKPIIIKYLCDNKALFPLFCTEGICTDDCGDPIPQEGRDLGIQFY